MWRAFHTAEADSVGDPTSAGRPSFARCWFTSAITWPARSLRTVPQSAPGEQSPTADPAPVADGATASGATTAQSAARTSAARIRARWQAAASPTGDDTDGMNL